MSYIFVPFANNEDNIELFSMALIWGFRVGLDVRGRNIPQIRIYGYANCLAAIQHNESLYIISHGGPDEDYVGNRRDGLNVQVNLMTADELARRVASSGLPTGHITIKLYICNVAGAMQDFAELFKATLMSLNYNNLRVYYYAASVSVPQMNLGRAHKYATFFEQPGNQGFQLVNYRVRASSARVEI